MFPATMLKASLARNRLTSREYAFLGAVVLFWACFVVVLGKDTSWDFRNYHWYAPYAFFHHREGFDVAVRHQASYYNPYLDIPFYLIARHTHSWLALGCLGAAQGANVVPLYLMARACLTIPDYKLGAGALALLGQFGALTLSEFGTTYYDNVMSVFVFVGLAVLVVHRAVLRDGPFGRVAMLSAAGGPHHRHGDGPQAAGDAVLCRLRRGPGGAGRRLEASGRCVWQRAASAAPSAAPSSPRPGCCICGT